MTLELYGTPKPTLLKADIQDYIEAVGDDSYVHITTFLLSKNSSWTTPNFSKMMEYVSSEILFKQMNSRHT